MFYNCRKTRPSIYAISGHDFCLYSSSLIVGLTTRHIELNYQGPKWMQCITIPCVMHIKSELFCCRYLSRWDIQVALRGGCPSIDRKVINSGKRLRAHVGLDEGEVNTWKCVQRNLSLFTLFFYFTLVLNLPIYSNVLEKNRTRKTFS